MHRASRNLAAGAAKVAAVATTAVLSVVYAAFKLLPVRNKVVLMSRLYSTSSRDFAAVQDEIARQDPAAEIVTLNHRNLNSFAVPLQLLSQAYHLATARACITDSYMIPISVLRHRRSLVIVQIWHALGAVKAFGKPALDTVEGRESTLAGAMHMHRGYDWVIAGGPGMVEPFAAAFGVDVATVLPLGGPRMDKLGDPAYLATVRERIRERHPTLGSRPVVLYAPTFRRHGLVDADPLLTALVATGADIDIVVALHPLDPRDFSDRPRVIQDSSVTTLDWLAVADEVVTDYSAIVFDAAIVGMPLYFYVYDLDLYKTRLGLFLDPESELPGPVSRDAAEVARAISAGEGSRERVAAFRERYLVPADGGSTRRIVAVALGARPEDLA